MNMILASIRFATRAAVLTLTLATLACTHPGTTNNVPLKPIPPAPVGVASSGIGGSGGDSADTRAGGTVATGEGDQPMETRSGVAPITATPGTHATGRGVN